MAVTLLLAHSIPVRVQPIPTKKPISSSSPVDRTFLICSKFNSEERFRGRPLFSSCRALKNEESGSQQESQQEGFFVLKIDDVPWESTSVWTTLAFYLFSLHIPLSFGGLSIVSQLLNQPNLGPEAKSLSVLAIQTLELLCALLLLQYTSKPEYNNVFNFFNKSSKSEENGRSWLVASVLGFMFLVLVVFFSSVLADWLVRAKTVNDPVLKEILSSGTVSTTSCFLVYCVVAPVLEEVIYRGFLLTSLASTPMKWQLAVVISSAVFSASHLSAENSLQLFVIGVVLGCSYCWSGNLRSSVVLHSLYNAFTLLVTLLS